MKLNANRTNQLARYFNKNLNEEISSYGLYSSQWGIIMYLHEQMESTQVEIGEYLGVEAATITRTLTRMEKMGWVTRKTGKDKREKIISLSEKAINMYSQWERISNDIELKAIEGIDKKDLEVFRKVSLKMMKNLD